MTARVTQPILTFVFVSLVASVCHSDMIIESANFDDTALIDGGNGVVSTISIMEQGLIQDISVTINDLQHSSVGDLIAELRFVGLGGGQSGAASLFFRPNMEGGTLGSSANLFGNYTFTSNEEDASFWSETAIPDDETVDSDLDYFASDENGDYHDIAGPEFFGNANSQGDWQLFIIDAEEFGNNEGSVASWTLQFHVNPIPEPGFGAVLILLATGTLRRRRQNR